ncbi:MAG: hypothetical protein WCY62_02660 [Clostridia bacterium]|jgi:hypothetical protein
MENWYYEKTVYRKKTGKDDLISLGAIMIALAISAVSYIYLGTYAFIIWLVAVYGCYLITTSRKYDYEYIFVEDTLTIDKIINKSRRKNIFTGSLKDFDIIAANDSEYGKGKTDNVQQTITAADMSANLYFGITYYKSQNTLVYFEADDRIREFIRKYAEYKFKE